MIVLEWSNIIAIVLKDSIRMTKNNHFNNKKKCMKYWLFLNNYLKFVFYKFGFLFYDFFFYMSVSKQGFFFSYGFKNIFNWEGKKIVSIWLKFMYLFLKNLLKKLILGK